VETPKKAALLKRYRLKPHLPRHVAIIMDGNGRWAKAKGLPRTLGHRAGVAALKRTVEDILRRHQVNFTLEW